MNTIQIKTFRSRISVLIAVGIAACCLPILIRLVRSGNILNPGFYTIVAVLACCALVFTGIRYVIADGCLSIKMWGMTIMCVEISQIISAKRSYNPLSSPAASLKRLCIRYKKGREQPYCLISPAREQEFLDTLKEINPNIEINLGNRKTAWYHVWNWDIDPSEWTKTKSSHPE